MKIPRQRFVACPIRAMCIVIFSMMTACGGDSLSFAPVADPTVILSDDTPDTTLPDEGTAPEANELNDISVQSSAIVEVLQPGDSASITEVVLVTGQSNALGGGTSFDEFLDAPNNRVMAFTDNGWEIASLNQVWDLNWYPRTDPNTPPSNNFALHFGKRVASQATDRIVGIILLHS